MINQIVLENKNLIYSIINKYTYYYDKEDLFQTGVIGLIKAYNNYNSSMNTKFSTYAYTYILSEVLLFINSSRNIKLSRDYQKLYKKILEARSILTQKFMKEPSSYEIALFLGIDENIINYIIEITSRVCGLEEDINNDLSLLDIISNDNKDDLIDNLILKEEINKLSTDEKKLLWMRYYDDRTQQEVASVLGTNQVYVSRNEKKILKKLKDNLSLVSS